MPEVDDPTTKLLTIARRTGLRIGTCSTAVMEAADEWDLAVVNLHSVITELAPDHVPGERMQRLPGQGGPPGPPGRRLPAGRRHGGRQRRHPPDRRGPGEITVLSTRPTSQGLMVFAKLAPPTEVDEASPLHRLDRPDAGRHVAGRLGGDRRRPGRDRPCRIWLPKKLLLG